jgi:acetylornithine deacetylase/succinyl-diaminopimelate desuccinylase-like protein
MKTFNSNDYYNLTLDITRDLCRIPAPSGLEDKRAEYVLNYVKNLGCSDAYIDSAKNVIWKIGGNSKDCDLLIAHTDTVFPDLEPMEIIEDDTYLKCPGVFDDTVNVAILLAITKYIKDSGRLPQKSLIFSANSCEEGLGNLKGTRELYKNFGDKVDVMYTFDGHISRVVNKSVGSHRYKVTAITEGGHSFNAFGNRNAITILSKIVSDIYNIEVPKKEDTKTTYNVGVISGGTSVNTIAQQAEMLLEYRSDDSECLEIMRKKFSEIFESAKKDALELKVELIGDRPGMGNVDKVELEKLTKKVIDIQQKYYGYEVIETSGSTDANIFHSHGKLSVCIGAVLGGGSHTREEFLVKSSVHAGLMIVHDIIF